MKRLLILLCIFALPSLAEVRWNAICTIHDPAVHITDEAQLPAPKAEMLCTFWVSLFDLGGAKQVQFTIDVSDESGTVVEKHTVKFKPADFVNMGGWPWMRFSLPPSFRRPPGSDWANVSFAILQSERPAVITNPR